MILNLRTILRNIHPPVLLGIWTIDLYETYDMIKVPL